MATGPWHYIDIPIDKPHLDMARDCPKGDCVIAKIEDFKKVVVDPAATAVQRREALMFLVHFVGDMHQPLHCSDNKDKGGNDVKLDFFGQAFEPAQRVGQRAAGAHGQRGRAVHAILEGSDGETGEEVGQGDRRSRGRSNRTRPAQKVVYGKLPKAPAGGQVKMDAAYERLADPGDQGPDRKSGRAPGDGAEYDAAIGAGPNPYKMHLDIVDWKRCPMF